MKDYYHTIIWMQEAIERLTPTTTEVNEVQILEYLSFALYEQGNMKRALHMAQRILKLGNSMKNLLFVKMFEDPDNELAGGNIEWYTTTMLGKNEKPNTAQLPPIVNVRPGGKDKERDAYEALCRGDNIIVRFLECLNSVSS